MSIFELRLLSSEIISPSQIQNICNFYDLNAKDIANERNDFLPVFQSMVDFVSIEDIYSDKKERSQQLRPETLRTNGSGEPSNNEDCENDDKCDVSDDDQTSNNWIDYSFVKPLRALEELSLFPNLLCFVKILTTIAVTSCSAERAMSRVKIIKNRLRSTMIDDWFSSLTVLASERVILESLQTKDIIDRFAMCSTKLQRLLMT